MSYEPTTWKDGDLVTSAKLNKIEQGIANSGGSGGSPVEFIELDQENMALRKTAEEIIELTESGKLLVMASRWEGMAMFGYYMGYQATGSGFMFIFLIVSGPNSVACRIFTAENPSDYPTYDGN